MIAWSGRKKALMILAFIGPTLLGILLFNIYPIIYNVFISFTNRNQYHPNPDCSIFITSIIEPKCWPMFRASAGVSTPYVISSPALANYASLIGELFTSSGLISIVKVLACFVPLIAVSQINKY